MIDTEFLGAETEKGYVAREGAIMSSVPTTCPFCGCGCGFYLLTESGRLRGIAPSEHHPVSHGRICARGWCAHEAPLWGPRLTQPTINAPGSRAPITWPDALDRVICRIKALQDQGKPVGILGSARATNEENYLASKIARAALHNSNVDFAYYSVCRPLLEGVEDVAGDSAPRVTLQDVESSERIVLIEGDLAETHPQAASAVMRALEKHARLITIGCRTTQMARISSVHFPAAPGCEGEVINGLLASILEIADGNPGVTPANVEGYEVLRRTLREASATNELRQAANWIVEAKNVTYLLPPTSGTPEHCRKDAAALATLCALSGHLNKSGSGILQLLARSNARGACDMGVAHDRLPGYEPITDGPARARLEKLWGVNLPADGGMNAESLLEQMSGLIVVADDPAASLAMGQRALESLRNIEFLVVLDAFATPTAEMAHVTLPIASFAETEGTMTNMEGRVQCLHVATDPPGEARAGWEALAEICARLGMKGNYASAAGVLREIADAAPRYGNAYERALKEGWSESLLPPSDRAGASVQFSAAMPKQAQGRFVLTRGPAFDWAGDPFVAFSPTLSRDSRAERKLFPAGVVEISQQDANSLGIHAGRRVKLTSVRGDVVVPVRLREDLKPGVLMVPYAFRDSVAIVLGRENTTGVTVEPA